MLVADLIARLDGAVAPLAGRLRGAADLAALMKQGGWPQASPAGFVLPLGLVARGQGDAAAGAFTQRVDELFGVVLSIRAADDVTGARALPKVDELVWAIIDAVCGWGPDEAIGVFQLRRGQLLQASAGHVVYQLDFALQHQVRIVA